ncbi:MAG TPA: hypothetical protein VFR35_11185, partial [Actinoplanes sp.]|nr:hypothetical protein [Actinoplanes sp.]
MADVQAVEVRVVLGDGSTRAVPVDDRAAAASPQAVGAQEGGAAPSGPPPGTVPAAPATATA